MRFPAYAVHLCCVHLVVLASTFAIPSDAYALRFSVGWVNGDVSRDLLGDGTGVIIGVVDTGIDSTHPALAGTDSLGRPRLVAEETFLRYPPANAPDDASGHGTAVASIALSADSFDRGLAPDARYVNVQSINGGAVGNMFESFAFAIEHDADILNLSFALVLSNQNDGSHPWDLYLDWAASELGVVAVSAVGNYDQSARTPASNFNGIAVGQTARSLLYNQTRVIEWIGGSHGYTSDGRIKPDIVAPGFRIYAAVDEWETEDDFRWTSGSSISAPHVAGMLAQQIEAGRERGWSVSPLVLKSTLLNSAAKERLRVTRGEDRGWQQDPVDGGGLTPLDPKFGAGEIDGAALAAQYLAGEQGPGFVDGLGWDLNSIGHEESLDYQFEQRVMVGTTLTATLTWFRHVDRIDGGAPGLDADDIFSQSEPLDTMELAILRDDVIVASSTTTPDNLRHLVYDVTQPGNYTVRVLGQSIGGASDTELYGLAWSATTVPEPRAWVLMAGFGALFVLKRQGR